MTPQEFTQIGELLFGGRGWQVKLANKLDVSNQTVNNYATGRSTIPTVTAKYMKMLKKDIDKT